jgi:hypothetical protein
MGCNYKMATKDKELQSLLSGLVLERPQTNAQKQDFSKFKRELPYWKL